MAVLLETSKGDLVVDLFVDDCPTAAKNFLKLCKIKYYNNNLFHKVERNFIAQTGDPTGTGRGGSSIYGVLYGEQARFFEGELRPHLKHGKRGTVSLVTAGERLCGSQFFITLADQVDSLDEKHVVIGEVAEGHEVLDTLNDAYVDDDGRPWQNIRIRHTIILDDPFEDPPELMEHIPDASPPPVFEKGDRLEDDWVPEEDTRPSEEVEKETRKAEAYNRAVVLEMIGDLPEAEVKPPSNMLFICKLNPVTTEEDLEIIFSRFGVVTSCDIIRDWKTGDSLCYAFLGFDSDDACEEAYFKMNNVLIDDRRIKVDFSQSVYHIWKQFRKFGRKGDAALAKAADDHQQDQAVRGDRLGPNMQLKSKAGVAAGARDLLFDHATQLASHFPGGSENGDEHKRKRRRSDPDSQGPGHGVVSEREPGHRTSSREGKEDKGRQRVVGGNQYRARSEVEWGQGQFRTDHNRNSRHRGDEEYLGDRQEGHACHQDYRGPSHRREGGRGESGRESHQRCETGGQEDGPAWFKSSSGTERGGQSSRGGGFETVRPPRDREEEDGDRVRARKPLYQEERWQDTSKHDRDRYRGGSREHHHLDKARERTLHSDGRNIVEVRGRSTGHDDDRRERDLEEGQRARQRHHRDGREDNGGGGGGDRHHNARVASNRGQVQDDCKTDRRHRSDRQGEHKDRASRRRSPS